MRDSRRYAFVDPAAPAQAVRLSVRKQDESLMIHSSRIRWIFFDVGDTLLDEEESMFGWCRQVAAKLSRPGEAVTTAKVWNARRSAYTEHSPEILGRILELIAIGNESSLSYDRSVYDFVKYDHSLERPFPERQKC